LAKSTSLPIPNSQSPAYLYNMIKKLLFHAFFALAFFCGNAQTQTAQQIDATAKTFMHKGDYANAVIVLNEGLRQNPADIEMQKDLAQSWYFQGNYDKALEVIKPVLDKDNADDQCYIIAGSIYEHNGDADNAKKVYREGLKKFPGSGPLYNVLGEVQFNSKDFEAIKSWEKGIETDPTYSRNYFNAARYYFFSTDKIWSILYGEIFINMEPNSSLTAEMKKILLDSYKKLFADADMEKNNKDKSDFAKTYLAVMSRQSSVATSGITTLSLSSIRTKFIIDWFAIPGHAAFKLFDWQQQLIHEGLFEAYNQWLFGAAENEATYQTWLKAHTTENDSFTAFQKNRVFRMPAAQYYH
jgi:tetratricopeptide (TPR) repeat protein